MSGYRANDKTKLQRTRILTGFGLLTTVLGIRFLTLGLYPLYDPSESRYAEMSRKMLETADWITPIVDYGVPFWGKPPLTIWMSASTLWLGGINEFSARLPSFLLSLGMIWIVFYLVRTQGGLEKAWSAVIILVSSVLFFVMAGTVAMDVGMSFGMTLALASFWLALREGKSCWAYLFFLGLSIGLMAKGPVTLVLCGTSIGLWTAMTGEWSRVWHKLPWFKGTLLMLALIVPWYLIAEHKTPGFLEYFFIGEHWKRFTESGWKGDLYGNGHAKPHGLIWVYWLGATFPWSLVFLRRLANTLLRKKPAELLQSNDGWRLYCLFWMLAPLLFFTFSANIIWTYVLPGIPGFALLLADWQSQFKYRSALTLCVPVLFLGLVSAYHVPSVDFFSSQKSLVQAYQQASHSGERLIYIIDGQYSAQFYQQGKVSEINDISALQAYLTKSNHDFYAIRNDRIVILPEDVKMRFELIKRFKTFSLFHAEDINTEPSQP
jgi:4-amino-4-deoxy-L-arabinose transferase-like glycosyltransferase